MDSDELIKFKAPFISKSQIQQVVDDFRNKYWKNDDSPIDVEQIVEFDLGIQIIPVKNLLNEKEIDAFISTDFRSITIDEDIYLRNSYQSRRRFSLGHEIGHLVLHKNLYRKLIFKTVDQWIQFIESIPEAEYSFIEYHAYEFSGKLLVPKETLIKSLVKAGEKFKSNTTLRNLKDFDLIKSHIYTNIGREFLVSDGVIERRINSEQINVKQIFEMD